MSTLGIPRGILCGYTNYKLLFFIINYLANHFSEYYVDVYKIERTVLEFLILYIRSMITGLKDGVNCDLEIFNNWY